MTLTWWNPPVPVKGKRPGLIHQVSSVEVGLEHMREWGGTPGPKYRKAYPVLVAALSGEKSPEEARKAFEGAAKEAGMMVAR